MFLLNTNPNPVKSLIGLGFACQEYPTYLALHIARYASGHNDDSKSLLISIYWSTLDQQN